MSVHNGFTAEVYSLSIVYVPSGTGAARVPPLGALELTIRWKT